jgi:hypothetical protein
LAQQPIKLSPLRPLLAAFVLITLLVNASSTSAAQSWPTTRFKVYVGNPYTGNVMYELFGSYDWIEFEDFFETPPDAVVAEVERAFGESASWYKRLGFPAPDLEPLIETEQGLAYRVYLCDYEADQRMWNWVVDNLPGNWSGFSLGSLDQVEWSMCGVDRNNSNHVSSGLYIGPCEGVDYRTRIMVINRSKSFDANGNLTETGHQTIAHELMHSIMSNTAFSRSNRKCHHPNKPDRWITEGIPDAIAYDIAEELWENRYYIPRTDGNSVAKRHGYRPYFQRLPQDRDLQIPGYAAGSMAQGHYGTSSFWRFVADSYARGWQVLLTEKAGGAPGLLDIPLPDTNTDWTDEVRWLDQGLRGKFNLGLKEIYGLFVSNFALRPAPFSRYEGKPAEDNIEHWAGILFDECEKLDLSSSGRQDFTLKLKGLASACVWVEPTGAPGMVQISFIAGHDDLGLLESISIGRAGTTLLSRASPIAHTPDAPTQYTAAWRDYPQDGSERTLYLFSNVAKDPAMTKQRELTFTAVLPGNNNSARATVPLPPRAAPPPQQPSYQRHAKRLSRQKADTAKMVQQQMNLDKESLNPHVSGSTQVSRVPNQPDCPDPFKYNPCGPQMRISLSLMPGSYIVPGQTNTAGGAAGQAFSGMQAIAQTSLFDTQQRVQGLEDALDTIDGSDVSIVIPLIDYGYSGSFDRASISVRMSGDRHCSAIDRPDQTQMTPLAGQVTIEEYSPVVLIGSFVAPLLESVQGPDGNGSYQSCGTVSGRFTSVAPFQADERSVIVMESTEQMAEDMVNAMGLPADMVYKMKQDGTLVPQGSNSSGSSGAAPVSTGGGGTISGDCSCECDMREFADDLCELFCEEEFAACNTQ